MMAKKQSEKDRLSALLASVNEDMLGDGLPQHLTDNSVKVQRILLELVRPDPIQPRRVLPDDIHQAFHANRVTPTQSLRELVQIAQVAARQRGRPFSNVLELLPDPERVSDDVEVKLTPEEELLRDLVNLAVTIRDDGQVNPITVIDVTQGVTQLFRIETGERRYWASWILRDFIPGEHDGMIDCIVVPGDRSSIFRQAKENTARSGLSAIAMARQAALLLLTANDFDIPAHAVTNDFYRQALDLRIPRGQADQIYSAMGGINKVYFSYIKNLLRLSDEAMELADRHRIEEKRLRPLIEIEPELHHEIVRQIIDLNLTSKQVGQIIDSDSDDDEVSDLQSDAVRLAKSVRFIRSASVSDAGTALIHQEGSRELARAQAELMSKYYSDLVEWLTNN